MQTLLVHGYMKSALHQQLQHSSHRRKRGKHPTATDFMYLNSLFWLAEVSCSQITSTSLQLSATLHCIFPLKHRLWSSQLNNGMKRPVQYNSLVCCLFYSAKGGGGVCEQERFPHVIQDYICHCQAQISYWFIHNRSCDPRYLYFFRIKTLTLLYSINTKALSGAAPSTGKAIEQSYS